jgi:GWxTD domain-containing protein
MVLVLLGLIQAAPDPAEAYKKWLAEEVVYIITDREKEVFRDLKTLEEQSRFIEAFWTRRDPNPATPMNEFRDEHYRRIEHANRFYGRETAGPGWRTDRGKYYIILGEPKTIERFNGRNDIVDTEVWFYQGETQKGLPGFFYLLFYQRDGVGAFELYHPIIDGPSRLFRGTQLVLPDTSDAAAVEILEGISTDLAHASLSFDAGQPPDLMTGRASLNSDAVLVRIEESPKRAVRTDYLDAYLRYGNRVAADYSFNFVPSRSAFAILAGPENAAIVHYTLEIDPENFGLASEEDRTKFYTTLDVTLEARTPDGTLVLANDRSDFIELSPAEVARIERYPIAYQDAFPLVPGAYTISVTFRNRALKRYTVVERDLVVPDFGTARPVLTPLVLAHAIERGVAASSEREVRTFQLGSLRLAPSAESVFAVGDTIFGFTQVVGAAAGTKVRVELVLGEEVLDWKEVEVDPASGGALAELGTLGATGGNYVVRARLGDSAEASAPLTLSPRTALPRPNFVYRRGFNTAIPGLLPLVLGDQWSQLGRSDLGRVQYEKAVAAGNPQLPQARWKLAYQYLSEDRAADALSLLAPLEEPFKTQYEVVAGLGIAYSQSGDYGKAVSYLEKALTLRAPDTKLLNALGETCERLGDSTRAREYYQRSLAVDPNQPRVRERASALK